MDQELLVKGVELLGITKAEARVVILDRFCDRYTKRILLL